MAGSITSWWNPTRAIEKIYEALERRNVKAAEFMVRRAKELCPVDTGHLRSTIAMASEMKSKRITVVCTARYATWVEFGHATVNGGWVPPVGFFRNAFWDTKTKFKSFGNGMFYQMQDGSDHSALTYTEI